MRFRGPLADSYGGAVLLVLLALTPYLVLSTALAPLQPLIAKDLGLSARAMGLTAGMANAAYAFGAVLAVQIGSRVRPRRMLVVYATLFVIGSALAAWAPVAGLYVAGHVTQGLATGLLLIGSVPPLVLSWGAEKLSRTAIVMNLGIFGAVALGPVVGGVAAGSGSWRPLLWIVCAVGGAALAFALLTFEDAEAQDPDAPVDIIALLLAAGGCGAAFFGVSELMGRRAIDAIVLWPMLAGLAMLVGLVVHQWYSDDPLIPVRKIAHTVPVMAIVIAMAAGAASVALVQLTQTALQMKGVSPRHAGMLFWPEIGMSLVAAVTFSRLFFTRYTPLLALGGLAVLAAGGRARRPDAAQRARGRALAGRRRDGDPVASHRRRRALVVEVTARLRLRGAVVANRRVRRSRRLTLSGALGAIGLEPAAQTTEHEGQPEADDDDEKQQEDCDSAFHGLVVTAARDPQAWLEAAGVERLQSHRSS
jgi:MFS family permease